MSHDRLKDAEKTIRFIGKVNGHKHIDIDSLKRLTATEKTEKQKKQSDKKYTILDILRNRRLLKLSLVLSWIW